MERVAILKIDGSEEYRNRAMTICPAGLNRKFNLKELSKPGRRWPAKIYIVVTDEKPDDDDFVKLRRRGWESYWHSDIYVNAPSATGYGRRTPFYGSVATWLNRHFAGSSELYVWIEV